jgi:hypothetical protein
LIKKGKHFPFFRLRSFSQITVSLSFKKQLEAEQFISVEQEHFSGPINFRYFFPSIISFMFLSSSSFRSVKIMA